MEECYEGVERDEARLQQRAHSRHTGDLRPLTRQQHSIAGFHPRQHLRSTEPMLSSIASSPTPSNERSTMLGILRALRAPSPAQSISEGCQLQRCNEAAQLSMHTADMPAARSATTNARCTSTELKQWAGTAGKAVEVGAASHGAHGAPCTSRKTDTSATRHRSSEQVQGALAVQGACLAVRIKLMVQPGAQVGGRLQQLLPNAASDGRRVHAPRVECARRRMVRCPRNILQDRQQGSQAALQPAPTI